MTDVASWVLIGLIGLAAVFGVTDTEGTHYKVVFSEETGFKLVENIGK